MELYVVFVTVLNFLKFVLNLLKSHLTHILHFFPPKIELLSLAVNADFSKLNETIYENLSSSEEEEDEAAEQNANALAIPSGEGISEDDLETLQSELSKVLTPDQTEHAMKIFSGFREGATSQETENALVRNSFHFDCELYFFLIRFSVLFVFQDWFIHIGHSRRIKVSIDLENDRSNWNFQRIEWEHREHIVDAPIASDFSLDLYTSRIE